MKYAQAKLTSTIDSSNAELDDLEAEQAARAADKPWLASDSEAPTLAEAKARIEWEAEEQRRMADAAASAAAAKDASTPAPSEPADAEVAQARVELDRQAKESAARLEAIRKELGVDPPAGGV